MSPTTAGDHPLVSVIVPNYNYGRSIGLCVEAALAQTYPNIEVLVVDDCSTDDSAAIAAAAGARVVSTGVNSGVAVARNLGAALSSGEILVFLDSDVAMHPDAVAKSVELLGSGQGYGAICGTYEPEPLIRDSLIEEYRSLQQYYLLLRSEGVIDTVHTAILAIPRQVFDEVGPFNPILRHTEDQDYGRRISERYTVLSSLEVLGRHDHDDTVRIVLDKVFARARLAVPLILSRRALQGGFVTGPRAGASLAAPLTVAALAAPLLWGAWWALLPLALFGLGVWGDLDMYRVVRRHRGRVFLGYFVAVNFLVNLTVCAAIGVAGVQWLCSKRFRHLYDPQPRPDLPAATAGVAAGASRG
ncbi:MULTISPECIES: glycosyltransferase family A protein [Streptomyces]|uniref:glycosyltransferase family 2 protein n=1 Tax=Streptomyces TaxID=1883 RepID=UPI00093C8083|nr:MULTISPECIES: glycosyltransferase family A protein [Streptomyces]MBX9423007.1 glycosyltransferase [Streptomyces lateritius]OKJ67695.1 glycosyl transferase [Streptomyces sp. CB02261]